MITDRSPSSFAVKFQVGFGQNIVEHTHRPIHTFAISHTPFVAYLNFKDALARLIVIDHFHITELQQLGLVGAQSSIDREQCIVVQLLGIPFVAGIKRRQRPLTRCPTVLSVSLSAKPFPT